MKRHYLINKEEVTKREFIDKMSTVFVKYHHDENPLCCYTYTDLPKVVKYFNSLYRRRTGAVITPNYIFEIK